jgi:hypothetical protein
VYLKPVCYFRPNSIKEYDNKLTEKGVERSSYGLITDTTSAAA